MVEVKQSRTTKEPIDRRLHNSGDTKHADAVVQRGDSPSRTFTNVHNTRNQSYGPDHPGEGDIFGRPRGPANSKGEIP
jgi:hypothetical protein